MAKYRLLASLSLFKGGKGLGRGLLLLLAFVAVAFSLISFAIGIYTFVKIDPVNGARLLENLMVLSYAGMFTFILVWGLSFAVNTIFFSNDLPMLFSMPIRPRDIFIFKTLETTFINIRLAVFFLPILIIYGLVYKASIPYYCIIPLVILAIAVIPGSLGIVLASLLTRGVPRNRLKTILTVTGSLVGVALWALINQFSGRFSSDSADFGSDFMRTAELSGMTAINFLPSGWAYKATQSAAVAEWGISVIFLGILLICSIVLTYLAYIMTARHYAGGIADEISSPAAKAQALFDFKTGGFPILAYIKRDLILLSREPGVMIQNGLMLIFLFLFPFISSSTELSKEITVQLSPVAAMFSAFFGGQIGSRMFALERAGFWKNLIIPCGRRMTLISKMIWGLILTLIGVVFVGLIHLALGKIGSPKTIFLMSCFAWNGFAIGLPLGIIFADYKWDHPKRMLKGGGGFIYAITTMLAAGALYAIMLLGSHFFAKYFDPMIILPIIVMGLMAISISMAYTKLENMEWIADV